MHTDDCLLMVGISNGYCLLYLVCLCGGYGGIGESH